MRHWLLNAIDKYTLDDHTEGYLLGRGFSSTLIDNLNVGVWKTLSTRAPSTDFHKYGVMGHRLNNMLCIPLYSPRGVLLGCEYRSTTEKKVMKYYLPDVKWAPVFGGMYPKVFDKIVQGADVWLVEGVFDMCINKVLPTNHVVLSMGGARMSKSQLNFLSRFVRSYATVHICFDMDETGRNQSMGYKEKDTGRFMWGVKQRLDKVNVNTRVVSYFGGKDPGEIWEVGGNSYLRESLNL